MKFTDDDLKGLKEHLGGSNDFTDWYTDNRSSLPEILKALLARLEASEACLKDYLCHVDNPYYDLVGDDESKRIEEWKKTFEESKNNLIRDFY